MTETGAEKRRRILDERRKITGRDKTDVKKKFDTRRPTINVGTKKKKQTGAAGFVERNINPGLQKVTEFLGAEFKEDERGELSLTKKGVKDLAKTAVITGVTGAAGKFAAGAFKGAKFLAGGTKVATKVSKAAVIGKKGFSGTSKIISKGANFPANTKTKALSKSLFRKVVTNPSFIIGAIGSYPFAGFIKEEALQTLQFPINKALSNGDVETARELTTSIDEMLDNQNEILSWVPYANVVNDIQNYFKAVRKSNDAWKNQLNILEQTQSGERDTEFEREKEESRVTDLKNRVMDAEYFRLIREGRYEEAEEFLRQQVEGGN